LGDGEAGVSRDVDFGPKPVPNPADAQLPDLLDAFHGDEGFDGLIDERGINGIHQPSTHLYDRRSQHTENHNGNGEAYQRVGPSPPNGNSTGTKHHGKTGETVSARVQAIGHQSG
jgi:hypothetical protein